MVIKPDKTHVPDMKSATDRLGTSIKLLMLYIDFRLLLLPHLSLKYVDNAIFHI